MSKILTELQFENEVIQRLAVRIQKYTPIIFSSPSKEKDELNHLASSILLKWKEGYFLVLTAHTRTKGSFFTTNGDEFFSIDGPVGALNDTNLDVKIIRLNQNFIDEFITHGFEFYDLNNVAINHEDLTGMKYLVVGYPSTKVKKTSQKSKDWKSIMFVFRTRMLKEQNLLNEIKVSNTTHIALNYHKDKIYNISTLTRQQSPDLEGLSGCGIWRVPTLRQLDNDVNNLNIIPSGIIVRQDRKNNALIGTRLSVIVNVLNRFLDEMERKGLDINNLPAKHRLD